MKLSLSLALLLILAVAAVAQVRPITESEYLVAFQAATVAFDKAPARRRVVVTKTYQGRSLTSTVEETLEVAGKNERGVKVVRYGEGRLGDVVETTEWRRVGVQNYCGDKFGKWYKSKVDCLTYYANSQMMTLDIGIAFDGGLAGAEAPEFKSREFAAEPAGPKSTKYSRRVTFLMPLSGGALVPVYDNTSFIVNEKGEIVSIETESGNSVQKTVLRRVTATFTTNPVGLRILAPVK